MSFRFLNTLGIARPCILVQYHRSDGMFKGAKPILFSCNRAADDRCHLSSLFIRRHDKIS